MLAEEYYVDSKAQRKHAKAIEARYGKIIKDDQRFSNHAAMLLMSNKYTPSTSFTLKPPRCFHFQGIGWLSLLPKSISWFSNTILWLEVPGPSLEGHMVLECYRWVGASSIKDEVQ